MKSTENNDLQNTLRLSPSWIPFITQTRRGMANFLTSLYVIIEEYDSNKTSNDKNILLGFIRYLFPYNIPFLLSFKILIEKRLKQLTPSHKALIANGFFQLFRDMIPYKYLLNKNNYKIFEYSNILLNYIVGYHNNDNKYLISEKYNFQSLICSLSLSRLINPINLITNKTKIYSKNSILNDPNLSIKNYENNKKFELLLNIYNESKDIY